MISSFANDFPVIDNETNICLGEYYDICLSLTIILDDMLVNHGKAYWAKELPFGKS